MPQQLHEIAFRKAVPEVLGAAENANDPQDPRRLTDCSRGHLQPVSVHSHRTRRRGYVTNILGPVPKRLSRLLGYDIYHRVPA